MNAPMRGIFGTATTADGRQKLTADRTVFIHDWDGVHHTYGQPHGEIKNIYDFYADTKVMVVKELLPQLSPDDIRQIGLKSYKETGDGLLLFTNKALDLGVISHDEAHDFRKNLFHEWHRIGTMRLHIRAPEIFMPDHQTNGAFERLYGRVRHGLLTQSCLRYWSGPQLDAQDKRRFFDPDALMDFVDIRFVPKAQSYAPLAKLMSKMGARPEHTVFIEDSLANLERAKELDPRILTVYVCGDLPLDHVPGYVDIQVRHVADLLNMAADLHKQPRLQTGMDLRR